MSYRSGMISDLNNLVNEATTGSRSGRSTRAGDASTASRGSMSMSRGSLSSFSQSAARVARAAETKEAASIRSGGRSVSSRSFSAAPPSSRGGMVSSPSTSSPPSSRRSSTSSNSSLQSNGSNGSGSRRSDRSDRSDTDRTNTTERLMSLVQELSAQGSGSSNDEVEEERRRNDKIEEEVRMLRDTLQGSSNNVASAEPDGYGMHDNSHSVDDESLSLATGLQSSLPSRHSGVTAPPLSRSLVHVEQQQQHGVMPMPAHYALPPPPQQHRNDPSVAHSLGSSSFSHGANGSGAYNSNPYVMSAAGSGSQDPVGYVMQRPGMAPSIYSQPSSHLSQSQYSNSYAPSNQDPSIMSHPSQSQYSNSYASSNQDHSVANGEASVPSRGGASASVMSGSMNSGPVMSASYMSQSQSQGQGQSQSQPSMSHSHPEMTRAIVPPMYSMGDSVSEMGGRTFESSRSRSIAGSQAIIPKAKFSWASESLGTQSTVMTRRSLATASVPEPEEKRTGAGHSGRMWASLAWFCTFMIPNKCIRQPTKDAKQAWREKVCLFLIMVSCSVFFVGVFGFVPLLLCKEDTVFSLKDIWLQTNEAWIVVHGTIYDVKDLIYRHPGGVDGMVDFLGKDASKLFPRAPPVTLPQKCLDMEKVEAYDLNIPHPHNNFTNPTCESFSEMDELLGIDCHTFAAGSNGTQKFLGDYDRGILSHTTSSLNENGGKWIAIYDRVYNVTSYVNGVQRDSDPGEDDKDMLTGNPSAYLTPTLNKVIMNSLNSDATVLYEALFGSTEYIACLEESFYVGILDDQFDTFCYTLNIMMYVMLIFVATLMLIQFLASMVYICPRNRTYTEEDVMSPIMIMVPCYNEGDNELRKTIKSCLNTSYPDENKVLFMVADGIVTGNGEDMSTPEHLANILGFDIDEFEDDTFEYDCIGVLHTKNRARVYHGILQKGHKFLKYIVIIKCGLPEEMTTSAKPGNRGKRDSQLVTIGYYNRIHYGRELTELDSAIQRAMVDLNLQADMVRFLMAIDADTRIDTMSLTHMVYAMDKQEKILALCGETKVDNKARSWVTMIQVFEYYNSHHLKKAFEAAFGCVTCLPGCFTMYRIIADDGTPLLPGDGVFFEYSRNDVETLHEKNLFHLGEDRMLTTLLLKYFPDRSLSFIPEALCWTVVPHTFRILLSQRRRWINSTIHNMFELLKVKTMCGVCCCSMKVVVFIDLIATMILPASYCYAMYLLFLVFFEDLPVSIILLVLYGIIMGVQIIVFVLRSRWDYLWWFSIYFIVGLPVFYLILPVYAFWNMDDFSWGKTRSVGGNAAANAGAVPVPDAEEESDKIDNEHDVSKPVEKGHSDAYRSGGKDDDDYSDAHSDTSSSTGSDYSRDNSHANGSLESMGSRESVESRGSRGSRESVESRGSRGSRENVGSRASRGSRESVESMGSRGSRGSVGSRGSRGSRGGRSNDESYYTEESGGSRSRRTNRSTPNF